MVRKQVEGDNRQRRQAAKAAREEGMAPSAAAATTGASKQQRHMTTGASHEDRTTHVHEGKLPSVGQGRPNRRPASGRPEQEPR